MMQPSFIVCSLVFLATCDPTSSWAEGESTPTPSIETVLSPSPERTDAELTPQTWFREGELTPCGASLISLLERADEEGLDSHLYHPILTAVRNRTAETSLSLLANVLTRALTHYLSWIQGVRPNLRAFDSTTHIDPQTPDMNRLVNQVICGNLPEGVYLGPQNPQYGLLKRALGRFLQEKAQGGWPTNLPESLSVKEGESHPALITLRAQLQGQGYPLDAPLDPRRFDQGVRQALRLFQLDHDLDPSGRLNPNTIKELNTPVDKRIETLRANLERWRWLPSFSSGRMIVVNIPTYQLWMFDSNQPVGSSPIVVGKTTRQTPSFATSFSFLTLNPSWTAPRSLALAKQFPTFLKTPEKAAAYQVISNQTKEVIPSEQINWKTAESQGFPYILRLKPGVGNPLGSIRFTIPNGFSIYMHGSPDVQLFRQQKRAFSWGCIRIYDPLMVAAFALDNTQWTKDSLDQSIKTQKTKTIRPKEKIPVVVGYWTAWGSTDGRIHFPVDIYQKDAQVLRALKTHLKTSAQILPENSRDAFPE
jgi:murein L,D-transpeptidase YcbB/YkuD